MTKAFEKLSRRERQIMDVIYQNGTATVSEVQQAIPDSPNYSSVRAILGILENKGYVRHKKNGRAYVYSPVIKRKQASNQMLKQMVNTFFDGSVENVVAALISMKSSQLSEDDFERLSKLIDDYREKEQSDD